MRLSSALMLFLFSQVLLVAGVGCGGGGPQISAGLSGRNLCEKTISGEDELRCKTDAACNDVDLFCWRPEPQSCTGDEDCPGDDNLCVGGYCEQECTEDANCDAGYLCTEGVCLKRGYCRECQTDGNCEMGKQCDHGWCHATCSADGDCDSGKRCTGGFCRTAHVAEFSFCNYGTGVLEIYTDQTKLYGEEDACAFSEWSWVPAGEDTLTMAENECTVYLQILFMPEEIGDYYAYIEVPSNSSKDNPFPVPLHGQVVEAECSKSLDAICEPPCIFNEETFKDIVDNKPDPGCE